MTTESNAKPPLTKDQQWEELIKRVDDLCSGVQELEWEVNK